MHKFLAAFLALFLLLAVGLAKDPPQVTDDTISDAVRVRLAGDQLVGVLPLQVTVKQGVVTLAGLVEQKSLKTRAENVTKKVKGVKQVVNNIEIKTRTSGK
ncbi:MAG: BON domain-containing protein [Candidatus Solibacter sp.]|nr:BON domain-containing protein [Candidatus Solibacter sp.]